jgi:hypothetical protein
VPDQPGHGEQGEGWGHAGGGAGPPWGAAGAGSG